MLADQDVIIIGAGPAGLTAANLLGQLGVHALLIERNPGLSKIPKALMIDDEYFRLLERVGLALQVRPNSVGPVSYVHFSPFGMRLTKVEGRITEQGYATRSAIFQPEFERILLSGVRRFPSTSVAFGHELVDVVDSDDVVRIKIKSADGDIQSVTARYLLGADGSHSTIRKAIGVSFQEVVAFSLRHLVIDVAADDDRSRVAVTRLGWRRTGTSLPAPHSGRRYEFSLRPDEDAEELLRDEALARLFRSFKFEPARNVIRKTAYTFHARLASRMRAGRVFLLGDAAHIMPVFGSQGMNSGARDASNLAWKIALVLRGAADASLLDSYDLERREQVAQTIRAAVAAGQWQTVGSLPIMVLRHIVYVVAAMLPPVRRYFANLRYIPKSRITAGFVFGVGRGEALSILGQVLPNPLVHDGAADRPLDEVIGQGFALLGINVADSDAAPVAHPVWARIGARVVSIDSEGNGPAIAGRVRLRDNRFEAVLREVPQGWLLVRPDRVVAGAADSKTLAKLADEIFERIEVAPAAVAVAAE